MQRLYKYRIHECNVSTNIVLQILSFGLASDRLSYITRSISITLPDEFLRSMKYGPAAQAERSTTW